MKHMKKIVALCLAAFMAVGLLAACGSSSSDSSSTGNADASAEKDTSDIKIGLLLSGSSNDGGWSQLAADGVKEAAEALGCSYDFSENLASTDFESTMRGYADAGYDIIVAHGAEFLDTSKLVAPEYEDVMFINTSAQNGQTPNLAAIDFGSYQTGYLTGMALGLVSENGKIGVVCGMEGDTTVVCNNALIDGAMAVNDKVTKDSVQIVYTGSYDDQLKAKQAAQELINSGCDAISENADRAGIGAIQQCEESGVPNIVCATDYSDEGDTVGLCVYQDVAHGIAVAIEEAAAGTLDISDGATNMAAAEGVVCMTDFKGDILSEDAQATLKQAYEDAVAGKYLEKED